MNKLESLFVVLVGISVILICFCLGYVDHAPSKPLGGSVLNIPEYVNTQISAQATTTIAAWPGVLHSITLDTPVSNAVITVYDSATTTSLTTVMATITVPSSTDQFPLTLLFDGIFTKGLTIQESATTTITVNYQQQ